MNLYYQRPNRNPSVLTLKTPQRIQTAVASESCEDICFSLFHSGATGGRTGQCMITGAGKHTPHGATAATPRREIWLATLYNPTSILCTVYPAECRLTRKETVRTHAHTQKKALTYFLTFPWQQQTLHTRGARGLQLKQGLSLRESSAEDSPHFLLLNLPCFVCICWPLYLHTHTHTHAYCTRHCISPYLALVQAHTPNSKITRQSIQVFLVPHKALTVPWSAGLLWYTRPLHTQTRARTHTRRPYKPSLVNAGQDGLEAPPVTLRLKYCVPTYTTP